MKPIVRVTGTALLCGTALLALSSTDGRESTPSLRARTVSIGELRLRYVRAGAGTPVVLLHGYGESILSWQGVFDRLARDADVIALDLPGFGLSSKPPSGYTADSMATVVAAFLSRLDVRRVVLVGHSLGGVVATAMALRDPSRVLGLALVDPALITPWALADTSDSSRTGTSVRRVIAEYELLRGRFGGVHDGNWMAEDSEAAAYQPSSDPAYAIALTAVLREFDFAFLTPEEARRLTMPVKLIWGALDPVIPVQTGYALAERLPDATLVVLPRTWHRPQTERPTEVAHILTAFVRAVSRTAAEFGP
jgi:pyruvate dehydrogenase E2 component (dihydrolipoamide acetyltransferase)